MKNAVLGYVIDRLREFSTWRGLAALVATGGVLIAPVGPQGGEQKLVRLTRDADGLHESVLEPVSFVPLLGGVV